ncbi:MAG: glycosyltransferase family 9 protein [Deltaproteobacteria bacterium]|nr:glycosyltransferase family 9 protein [Deltaproteobacteria bacterium]
MLKTLERIAKRIAALLAIPLLWRPWRWKRAQAALARRKRFLVVRVDNRVGEAVLLTPVLATLKGLPDEPEVDVLVHPRCVRVLEDHPAVDRLIPFERERFWWLGRGAQLRALRQRRYDVIVDQGNWSEPSVTHALLARLCGPHSAVIGAAIWPVGGLRTHPVPALAETRREVSQRIALLEPLGIESPVEHLVYHPVATLPELETLLAEVREGSFAVVNPGGRLDWRRLPPEVFAGICETLVDAGRTPLITWGPREEGLARYVADAVPGARLAPPTSLDDLAALMVAAGVTVCNNTGPMHLSVAVGVPTFQLFLHMDPVRWGHTEPPHRVVDLTPFAVEGQEEAQRLRLDRELREFLAQATAELEERGRA